MSYTCPAIIGVQSAGEFQEVALDLAWPVPKYMLHANRREEAWAWSWLRLEAGWLFFQRDSPSSLDRIFPNRETFCMTLFDGTDIDKDA